MAQKEKPNKHTGRRRARPGQTDRWGFCIDGGRRMIGWARRAGLARRPDVVEYAGGPGGR